MKHIPGFGYPCWRCAGLLVVVLASAWGDRPLEGATGTLRFWNVDPLTEVTDEPALGASEPVKPIRLVGPRNGCCSAQIVVGGEGADKLKVSISPLKKGADVIAPASVRIRYATTRPIPREVQGNYKIEARYTNIGYFDTLHDEPPAGAVLLPIWITVRIPPEAQSGDYAGTLTVGATQVPVKLQVGAWKCPDPKDWNTHVGLLQSPETLALQYQTPLWSEAHWKLMESSLRAMAELGNRDLFIPVMNKTHLGNEWGMVRFTRNADGKLVPDLSVLERYLETYRKVGGNARALIFYLWDLELSGSNQGQPLRKPPETQIGVTLAGADGTSSTVMVPMYGQPGSEEFWKPVMDAIREKVKKLGYPDEAILLGQVGDEWPPDSTVSLFQKIAPYARWALYTHGRGDRPPKDGKLTLGNMPVGLYELPYVPELGKEGIPTDGIAGGWNLGFPQCCFPRVLIFQYSPLAQWRSMPEGTTAGVEYTRTAAGAKCGFTRIGLDYWDINNQTLLGRFGHHWMVRMYRIGPHWLIAPGPAGPLGTVRYEMLREGLQECEARIAIEKTMAGRKVAGNQLQKCTELLRARLNVRLLEGKYVASPGSYGHPEKQTEKDGLWGTSPAWQDLDLRLFNLAGEVAPGK